MMSTTTLAVDAEFARIVDELTRRGFLAGGLGTAGLAALAACSSGSPAASSGPTTGTRSVTSAYGAIEVPANPTRVVALSKAAIATLLDVGLTPAGVDAGEAAVALPQYQKTVAALPTVGSYGEFSVEKIAALSPDLIISYDTYLDAKLYPKLAAVAPTVALKTDQGNIAWRDATAAFADTVNRRAQLDALATQYADKLTSVASTYADQLAAHSWEIVQNANDGNFYRYLPSSDPSGILTELGARLGDTETGPDYWGTPHSNETLADQLGHADVLLYVKVNSQDLVSQKLWTDLPASRAGHAYGTDLLFPSSYSGAIAFVDFVAGICQSLKEGK